MIVDGVDSGVVRGGCVVRIVVGVVEGIGVGGSSSLSFVVVVGVGVVEGVCVWVVVTVGCVVDISAGVAVAIYYAA